MTTLWRFLLTMASSEESTIASYNRSAGIKVEFFFTESLPVRLYRNSEAGRPRVDLSETLEDEEKKEGWSSETEDCHLKTWDGGGAKEKRVAKNKAPLREGRRGAVNGETGGII
jgi:hypothetical protein